MKSLACIGCGQPFKTNLAYCIHCGTLPPNRQVKKASLWSSVLLGLGLAAVIGIGVIARMPDAPAQLVQQQPTRPQDDASRPIASCGMPDLDKTATVKRRGKPIETRTLVYNKQSVKLIYVAQAAQSQPANGDHHWMFDSARSAKSNQALQRDQLLKRLPCASR